MSTPVLMPQMGESIAEGTIVRWIKKVGDTVDRDEPLFEISTDKVDAEIPSPAAGVLAEIKVKEGETVAVNSVVATIGAQGEARPAGPEASPERVRRLASPPVTRRAAAARRLTVAAERAGPRRRAGSAWQRTRRWTVRSRRRPPVWNASANGRGRSVQGRAAPRQVVAARAQDREGASDRHPRPAGLRPRWPGDQARHPRLHRARGCRVSVDDTAARPASPADGHTPAFKGGESVEVVPMTVMRRKIAEHMVASRRTSAHVHSVFEVNFSRVAQLREQKKAEYERAGVKLTYMSFITKAVVDALRAVPIVNASVDGDNIVYKKEINIGIAVALDWGLIVPVLKNADEKNLLGLSRAIARSRGRARAPRA